MIDLDDTLFLRIVYKYALPFFLQYVPKVVEEVKRDVDSDDEEEKERMRQQAAHNQEEYEYAQMLDSASIEDIMDIADILGVAYQDHCLATALKKFPNPAPNDTNVDDVIKQVAENNPDCMEINLNNLKVSRLENKDYLVVVD